MKCRLPIHRPAIYDVGMPRSQPAAGGSLRTFGRYAGPATLILSSLADGAKHGYALTKDIEQFAGVRLAPGTLYEALSRLESQGLIEALASDDRRRPYQLTAAGARAPPAPPGDPRRVAALALGPLARPRGQAWPPPPTPAPVARRSPRTPPPPRPPAAP